VDIGHVMSCLIGDFPGDIMIYHGDDILDIVHQLDMIWMCLKMGLELPPVYGIHPTPRLRKNGQTEAFYHVLPDIPSGKHGHSY